MKTALLQESFPVELQFMNSRETTEVIILSRASMAWAAHGLSRMQTRLSRLGLGLGLSSLWMCPSSM